MRNHMDLNEVEERQRFPRDNYVLKDTIQIPKTFNL